MDLFGDALKDCHAGVRNRMLTIRRDDDHTDAHDLGLYFADDPFEHEAKLLELVEVNRSLFAGDPEVRVLGHGKDKERNTLSR
ncbi:MAG: hypothetical protein AAFR75_06360 [Pseudomonadota bacterium]